LCCPKDEYYTVHGDTALAFADRYFKTRDIVQMKATDDAKAEPLAQLVIRPQKIPAILKDVLLTQKEKAIALQECALYCCSQVEIWRKNKDGEWAVWKKGSPGNLQSFEDMLPGGLWFSIRQA